MPRKITHLVVHHSATARDSTTFESINQSHKRKNWGTGAHPVFAVPSSLGKYCQYHWFIEANGDKTQCRTDQEIGWHARQANAFSIGICLAGWFDSGHDAGPSAAQVKTLEKLLVDYKNKYNIGLDNIVPHRRFVNTSCYGRNLADDWAQNLIKSKTKTMSNVRLVKDKNGPAVGFFVPASSPQGLLSLAQNYGYSVPTKADGGVDWGRVDYDGLVEFD